MPEVCDDHRERVRAIRRAIRSEEDRWRVGHPWLARQDLLGLAAFLGSLAGMALVAGCYLRGQLSAWLAIPLMALPLSILHEIEHDLIHGLYHRNRPWLQNLMFLVVWYAKLGLNPWCRRAIHLRHHRRSGQKYDIEERLIGIGLRFGLLRILIAIHPIGSAFLMPGIKRDNPDFRPWRLVLLSMPAYIFFLAIWELFFGYVRLQNGWACAYDPCRLLPEWGWPWARDLAVLLFAPNVLRQTCLVLLSSYSHYYEDIPEGEVFYQNQILRSWLLLPLQLFCFNFGATHVIHHYVINQPFYLRQLVARVALAELERQGVRVNDFGSIARANRWQRSGSHDKMTR